MRRIKGETETNCRESALLSKTARRIECGKFGELRIGNSEIAQITGSGFLIHNVAKIDVHRKDNCRNPSHRQ